MLRTTTIYNGIEMASEWPARIRAAQKKTSIMLDGQWYARILYGQEQHWADADRVAPMTPCRDCGVLPGQRHVPRCCIEACPACLTGQAISCETDGCQLHPT